jgi:hypothetical protein
MSSIENLPVFASCNIGDTSHLRNCGSIQPPFAMPANSDAIRTPTCEHRSVNCNAYKLRLRRRRNSCKRSALNMWWPSEPTSPMTTQLTGVPTPFDALAALLTGGMARNLQVLLLPFPRRGDQRKSRRKEE